MSEIKMRYVFEKKINDNSDLPGLIRQILKDVSSDMGDGKIIIDSSEVFYSLKRGSSFSRYRLELISKGRLNIAVSDLLKLDKSIMTSPEQKHFTITRYYDGVSESFCERLYPKYARYERELRQLVVLVLSKAMGPEWAKQTLSDEQMGNIRKRAKGNISTNDIIENLDLAELENYLFERVGHSYEEIIGLQHASTNLNEKEKEELLNLLDQMKPKSLWERNFAHLGKQEDWEIPIKAVHAVRNKVAHHKTTSEIEFKETQKALNKLSTKIESTVDKIENAEFTHKTIADVMAGFNVIAESMSHILKQYDFSAVFQSIQSVSASFRPAIDAMTSLYSSGVYANLQATLQSSMRAWQESIQPIMALQNSMRQSLAPLCEMRQNLNLSEITSAIEPLYLQQFDNQDASEEKTVVVGVDGCKGGWIVASLKDKHLSVYKYASINEFVEEIPFDVCLIDMIIGLQSKATDIRPETEARRELKNRASTMFAAPSRQAVYGSTKEERLAANAKALGKKFTSQTDAIIPKIRELDEFMQASPDMRNKILESHPEVCFGRMNGGVLQSSKHTVEGVQDRVEILSEYLPQVTYEWVHEQSKSIKCSADDITDAVCLAIVATMIINGESETIPKEPMADATGLLMKLTVPKY
jgi:8-oxo-dGTP diphosphatase